MPLRFVMAWEMRRLSPCVLARARGLCVSAAHTLLGHYGPWHFVARALAEVYNAPVLND